VVAVRLYCLVLGDDVHCEFWVGKKCRTYYFSQGFVRNLRVRERGRHCAVAAAVERHAMG